MTRFLAILLMALVALAATDSKANCGNPGCCSRGAMAAEFRVVDRTGEPLPPGSVLRSFEDREDFPVGFGGETYVTGLERPRMLYVHTHSGLCGVEVPAVEPLPMPKRLGTLTCVDSNP